jgi:hypothetical protein
VVELLARSCHNLVECSVLAAQVALRQLLAHAKDSPGQRQQDENMCVVLRIVERLLRGERQSGEVAESERSAALARVYISLCQAEQAQCVERPLLLAYLLRCARLRPSFVAVCWRPPCSPTEPN